jgi:hypothetical protein
MGTKVTVVTLYDDSLVEHYVAVVVGAVSREDRKALAVRFEAEVADYLTQQEEDGRYLYFRELDTCASAEDVSDLPNIDGRPA